MLFVDEKLASNFISVHIITDLQYQYLMVIYHATISGDISSTLIAGCCDWYQRNGRR